VTATRRLRPDDLDRILVPTEPRLAPAGDAVVFTARWTAPGHGGYRMAIWRRPLDRGRLVAEAAAERLTMSGGCDWHARFSPDGRTLAFLSDRRVKAEEEPTAPKDREDLDQVYLLPLDRPGEARRLTDLPRGVTGFEWSPDGRRLVVVSASRAADRKADDRARRRLPEAAPGSRPPSDYWYFDRLGYELNGAGITVEHLPQLWLVDLDGSAPRRLTSLPSGASAPAWSPDGLRIAFETGPQRDRDLSSSNRVLSIDVATGRLVVVAGRADSLYFAPAWLDDSSIAVLGGHQPHAFYRFDVRRFAADGSEAARGLDLSGRHDVMPASTINSDITIGEGPRLVPVESGRGLLFLAPDQGAIELWRLDTTSGDLERLSRGEHTLSSFDAVELGRAGTHVAAIRSTVTTLPEVHVGPVETSGRRRHLELAQASALNAALQAEVELVPAASRSVAVDGREIQSWLLPAGDGRQPTVVEIHGGPHTLYGWAPMLEFQVLAAAGISVLYGNPRGSEGYGLAFNEANLGDWGEGPMRDVIATVDAAVADGLVDPDRLGVTGGSYGGYLTAWIIAHDERFRAAVACRSVTDLTMLMLTGDLGGTDWARYELGAYAWEDPERYRAMSPLTYASAIKTPLLIQHAEEDLRTTLGQAEALFSVLRRLRRPVRLMRVPGESHELTRAGTPFRRIENLVQIRDWFVHFLVKGRQGLPPVPRTRHARRGS
jgi:dipeptidyl aminopeptidase/acylaminoacyl peptidase